MRSFSTHACHLKREGGYDETRVTEHSCETPGQPRSERKRERRQTLTAEQRAERFGTGGLDFRASLRRVLAAGRERPKAETEEPEKEAGDE